MTLVFIFLGLSFACADQLPYELQSGGLRKSPESHLALVESLFHLVLQMVQQERRRYASGFSVIPPL